MTTSATPYPATYFPCLSPAWLTYVAGLAGVAKFHGEGFRYLELGCGRGLSTLMHAAAFPAGEFHACDMNRENIAAARSDIERFGIANLSMHPMTFDEFARTDLPRFDFIVMHGVYSWVSPTVRATLMHILETTLAPQGIAYVSYNCMPGWAPELPLRRLMRELAGTGGTADAASATALLTRIGKHSRYVVSNPSAAMAIDAYARSPAGYLVHEFMSEGWEALYSMDVADALAEAGLHYVGSATLCDNHLELLVDEPTAQVIASLPARLQALATDFVMNRQFRRDVFMPKRAGQPDLAAAERALVGHFRPGDVPHVVDIPRGRMTFDIDFINALTCALRDGPAPPGQLADTLSKGHDRDAVLRNIRYLVASDAMSPASREWANSNALPAPTASMLGHIVDTRQPGLVASQVAGRAFRMTPREAREVLDGKSPAFRLFATSA